MCIRDIFPTVQYISPIIDMGTPANWGRLRWLEDTVGPASAVQMSIRTRSGRDPSPFAYTRKRVGRQDAEEITSSVAEPDQPLLRDEYLDLPAKGGPSDVWERGPVRDDLANWSPWTSPYDAAAGTSSEGALVLSPGPRRYFQFRVDFQSDDLEAAKILRQFSFDFTTPPLADVLVGEIFPREVPAAADIPFVYAVRAEMESGDLQGFDSFELITGSRIDRIERIEIIDAQGQGLLAHDFAVQDAVVDEGDVAITALSERSFAVRFPVVTDDRTQVQIRFQTNVLTYSTNFTAAARRTTEPGAAQVIDPGNVAFLGEGDEDAFSGTTVLSPSVLAEGQLLGQVQAAPNPFTPNGDGINDEAIIHYSLLALSTPRPVEVALYDLSGRRVRVLFAGQEANGRYTDKAWDGRDDRGQAVPPGLYVARVFVSGDSGDAEQSHVVAVAY